MQATQVQSGGGGGVGDNLCLLEGLSVGTKPQNDLLSGLSGPMASLDLSGPSLPSKYILYSWSLLYIYFSLSYPLY